MQRTLPHQRSSFLGRTLKALGYTAVALLPVLAGAANLSAKLPDRSLAMPPPVSAAQFSALPSPDPAKRIAVVLASAYGAELTDFVAPYEILSRSGAFQVYALAPERKLLPLVNANMAATTLDFIPHYSFDEYDTHVGRQPDVIAIPWVPGHTPERDAAMLEWIRANAGPHTTLLTICAGTQILAETGLLDGRTATTNTGWFAQLEQLVPSATWVRGVRYYDDGGAITSTNVASGIDASLHAVDRLVGRAAAMEVARQIGYRRTDYLDDPRFDSPSAQRTMLTAFGPVLGTAAFQWGQQDLGVLLYDGVSELALGGLLDLYTSSLAAKAYLVAPERSIVHSRNGLQVVPRYDAQTAPRLDRVVLPGGDAGEAQRRALQAWAQVRPERPVEPIHRSVGAGETGYDATLRDIARTYNRTAAIAIGYGLFYAVDESVVAGTPWPVAPAAGLLGLSVLAGGLVYSTRLAASRRRSPHLSPA